MAEITNFSQLRAGMKWPFTFDLEMSNTLSYVGAVFYPEQAKGARLLKKESMYGIFIFEYSEEWVLPDWWEDAEVIWEFKPNV